MVSGSKQKYGLTHVDTERSMMHDVVSLAGYSIHRGLCPSHAIDSPVLSRSSAKVLKPVNKPKRRQDAAQDKERKTAHIGQPITYDSDRGHYVE